ncbi:cupin domain-containing protein [Phenylobacterium sp. J367]|uniref:cupin domain-containing protein n=1 Tax=Phenylobacterium sp. J367 TaxID=2898435 RepID=UPI0021511DCD|nr:cupin domain-containing protein [Phenylobacterium sp. J367]MCR5877697.1 cupin domain-containing protein [Phenylobacterium sp. J367]
MPKIELDGLEIRTGCSYPHPFKEICLGPTWRKLGDAGGLTDFGVNLVRLTPGKWSSQRHWHTAEDECVWILEGEVVLVEDDGEHILRPGDFAAWKAGVQNGHHLQNRTDRDAVYLEIGSRKPDTDDCDYPDIDMVTGPRGYQHRDGRPYPEE